MPRHPLILLAHVALAVLVWSSDRPIEAQSGAGLFDRETLHDLRLYVNSKDLAQLRARWAEDVYFPADLVWRDIRVRNVGIRSRGLGSRNPTKLALHVSMNRYTPSQSFQGLRSLILDNLWEDAAMMRRLQARGQRIRVRLTMSALTRPDGASVS